MSSLVIVESPAKAKTISKILGKGFTVKASVGHVRDLPTNKVGVDVENNFAPMYTIIEGKEKVIRELKQAAKGVESIYLAPDPDREGEAIAFHIAHEVGKGLKDVKLYRVAFNEITPRAVKEAMEHPGQIDMQKVEAQQARRILDRLVGYNLSPLLWRKVRRGLSAGRVQSVAVRMVVDREREIQAFNQEEYWDLTVKLSGSVPPEFAARLWKYDGIAIVNRDGEEGKRFFITNEAQAQEITSALSSGAYKLTKVDKTLRKKNPAPPFTTSTLQQESSKKLGYTAKRTMALAQQLYEGIELGSEGAIALITYMRTDSVRVAKEAQDWARSYVEEKYGAQYLPPAPPQYKSKANAQEAHEAIRPTLVGKSPDDLKHLLGRDQLKLYRLIWNRFLASQMRSAEIDQTTFEITCDTQKPALLRASGGVVRFAGFMALYIETEEDAPAAGGEDDSDMSLPDLKEGETLKLMEAAPAQHFTQPPPRYTEASLVKALEDKGIGRPSTYAAIMSTIVDRKYVHKDLKRFAPTELGIVVNDYLVEKFPELLDIGFTAKLEDKLDHIEDGKFPWVEVIREFYDPFDKDLKEAAGAEGKVKPLDIETTEVCDKCGKPMVIRWGRHGRFMACSGYPECKNAKPLEGERPAQEDKPTDEKCPTCGEPMVIKTGRFGKFIACTKYPECKTTKPIPTGVKCPEDGGDIVERRSRGGKSFWSCANYPKCTFALWNKPLPEPCPTCGATLLVIKKERSGKVVKACAKKECTYKEELSQGEE